MDAWFRIRTHHGTELCVDLQTAGVCHAETAAASGALRPLLAWHGPGRHPYLFLTPDDERLVVCQIPPDSFANTFLPFRQVLEGAGQLLALLHPGTGRYVCAEPAEPGSPIGRVNADRVWAKDWESFSLLPIAGNSLNRVVRRRSAVLGRLLAGSGATLDAAAIVAILHGDDLTDAAIALNAVLPILPLAELQRFAELVRDSPTIWARLARATPADVFATVGLQELSSWLTHRETGEARPRRWSLGADLDYLATAGHEGVPVSFGQLCNALARESITPRKEICAVATARNEGIYLLEWLAYHRAIGVEAFFIYSNDNDDGSDALLQALASAGVITWIDNRVGPGGSAQNKAYGHALGLLPDILDYRWALFIDLDEFLVLNPALFDSIREFLRYHELRQTDAIAVNWVFIGSSGRSCWRDEPVTRRFTSVLHGGVHRAVKTIRRPHCFIHSHAHFPRTHNRRSFVFRNAAGDLHRFGKSFPGILAPASSDNPDPHFACVYHYFFKSAEELLWKFSRNRGDHPKMDGISNTALESYMLDEFLEQHDAADLPTEDKIQRCAPNLDAEIAALRALPGVANALDGITRIYRQRIAAIKEAYRDAPVIRQAGDKGRYFLHLAGVPGIATSALDRMSDAELIVRFESLGDNCEFGVVQRRCHAEPLGLLRFSHVDRGKLLEGLANGFEGLGEPDDIEFQMQSFGPEGSPKEFIVFAKRYTLLYHTWVYEGQATPEEMRAREQKKLQFLKRKFFEDLEDAEKLWVHKSNDPVSVECIWPLVAALRRFGDNTLLWVVPHDAEHPPGTVVRLGAGLLQGHIDRFAPYTEATNVSVEGWLAVCRNAYALWRPEAARPERANG